MIFKSTEFKVGLLVLAAAVVLVILLMNASNWPLSAGKELKFHFDFVNDIQVGAPVHLAGVKIGKVTRVTLLETGDYQSNNAHPETPHAVEIRARINPHIVLRRGSKVTISTLGFVGEAYLEITNGPFNQPELPADEPIVGDNPVSIAELLEKVQTTVDIAMKTVKSAQSAFAESQDDLKTGIADVKQFIDQTGQTTKKTLDNVNELLVTLNQIVSQNGKQLDDSFLALNRIFNQVEADSRDISKQMGKITQELSFFIEKNASSVDKFVADVTDLSAQLKNIAQELNADIPELKEEFSNLLARTQDALDTGTPKLDNLLDELTKAVATISQLMYRFQHGEGTIAKLIDDPSGFDEMRQTLNRAQETMAEISSLARKVDKKTDNLSWPFTLKTPDLSYDYELRYRSLSETFRNEFALKLLSSKNRLYRMGLSVQGEDVNYEFQFGQRLGNFTARGGFIRSKVGLGFDYWPLSQRLGLTLEGINITTKTPEINFEVLLRFLSNWGIVLGAEYVIPKQKDFADGEFGFNAGIRAAY
ncbi:TPA: MCE family protein [Candidatus Poribacteria bacterium]|nr:MCE family protein [Candidatus Poribacteria bacterium]